MATWLAKMVAVAIVCLLRECSSFTMVVENTYQLVKLGDTYKLMCQADVPLSGCQVNGLYDNKVYDLSEGRRSQFYSGTGLEDGQCGFFHVAKGAVNTFYEYSCRARSHTGDWQYATAVVHILDHQIDGVLPLVTSPRIVIANPGSDVTFTLAAGEPLTKCSFKWPGQDTWVEGGSSNVFSIDKSDFIRGQCRLTLFGVTSALSGIVTSEVWSARNNGKRRDFKHLTTLIVKMPPRAPVQSLNRANGVYNEGEIMEASCHVGPARPVARISWLLGDYVILGMPEDFSTWRWEFQASNVTRKLSRKLSMADDGKELVCRVHHIALPGGVSEASTKITVRRLTSQYQPSDCHQQGTAGTNGQQGETGWNGQQGQTGQNGQQGTTGGRTHSTGGKNFATGEFPWHVGVYRSLGNNQYQQECGGTLISRTIVISAAHCFWDERQRALNEYSQYKVAAGKRLRAWSEQERDSQVRDVSAINVPERYQGVNSNYENDIAVVRLAVDVDWTTSVQPAYMDWSTDQEVTRLSPGANGMVAGWGRNFDGQYSTVLQKTDLPFVNFDTCFNALSEDLKKFYTDDKFCAGFANRNHNVCTGDSGGGLMFANDYKYYLRGVASSSFRPSQYNNGPCYSQTYSGFTRISNHQSWINTFVNFDQYRTGSQNGQRY